MRDAKKHRFSLHLAVAAIAISLCNAEIAMLFSINRHGARNLLQKNAYLNDSAALGGPSLLPQGQRMCYKAGVDFHQRYINGTSCKATGTCLLRWLPGGSTDGDQYGVIHSPGVGFNNYNTLVRSSSLDRTVQSAISFLSGVFTAQPEAATDSAYLPSGQQVVPVYTANDNNDDIIRAYTKCPSYTQNLTNWYLSEEFLAKSNATAAFRLSIQSRLQAFGSVMDTSLINWYNVYDAFYVNRIYGVGAPMPRISDSDYSNMTALAYWLEVSKMRYNLTGALLGGSMLGTLSSYINDAIRALQEAARINTGSSSSTIANATSGGLSFYQLLINSGHYNTQLGAMAAMALDNYVPAVRAIANAFPNGSWLSTGALSGNNGYALPKLPSAAAVMAWELHVPPSVGNGSAGGSSWSGSAEDIAVRLVIQDGPGGAYVAVPLPCGIAGDSAELMAGPGACTAPSFLAFVATKQFSQADWCTACGNSDVDYCRAAKLASELASRPACSPGSSHGTWEVVVAAVVSGLGMLLVCMAAVLIWVKRDHLCRPFRNQQRGATDKASNRVDLMDGVLNSPISLSTHTETRI